AYTDSSGVYYSADRNFSGGATARTTSAIIATTNDPLYQSERYGNFSYTFPMSNGTYSVNLKFAEIYFSAAGQRLFNVAINGRTVLTNFDIYARAGRNAAYDQTFPVTVTNGSVKIDFISVRDNAKVSAIRIVKATTLVPLPIATPAPTPTPTPAPTSVAVVAGGTAYTDSSGVYYSADRNFSGGATARTTSPITGTTNDPVYQSERYGNFSYTFPMSNGTYSVNLKFAEIYFSAAGQRLFNVAINGKTVLTNFDIYARAGRNAAYNQFFTVTVTNGTMKIDFVSVRDNAKVSAIRIVRQ
ncbi:MAG TPA: malectin, partial [Bdellovibrionota bacterium]|nr:malectin [Bdellovibrionota bacterium]